MMYFFRVKKKGFVRFDSKPGDIKFTDNWHLFMVAFSEDKVKDIIKRILWECDVLVYETNWRDLVYEDLDN